MRKSFSQFFSTISSTPSVLVSIFVVSVIGMNLLANKSVDTGIQNLRMDCGILFSAMSFMSMDIITLRYGHRTANCVSLFALIISLCTSVLFFFAGVIPGSWAASYTSVGVNEEVNMALNITFIGTWYVIAGSAIAFLSSSFLNNFLNFSIAKIVKGEGGGKFSAFALRSYISTFIAQVFDNLIFAFIVSKPFFAWSYYECFVCSIFGAFLELLFEIVLSPLGYRISKRCVKDERLVCSANEVEK